jgi:hypothetical protein
MSWPGKPMMMMIKKMLNIRQMNVKIEIISKKKLN